MAPPGSSSPWDAEQQSSLAWNELEELEQRLMSDLHRAGEAAADLAGSEEGLGSEVQELGRIGLQRLVTIEIVNSQVPL